MNEETTVYLKTKAMLIGLTIGLGAVGCANQQALTEQAMYQQYPAVAQLKQQLEDARQAELNMLSPAAFKQAESAYQDAVELAKYDNAKGATVASEGLNALTRGRSNAASAEYILEDVLTARNKAKAAGAASLAKGAFNDAEEDLRDVTSLIEQGKTDRAKAERSEIINSYRKIELAALKGNIVDIARDAIKNARNNDVDDVAPKTMRQANEDYQLALSTLDANRNDTQKAETHAKRSLWHTQRATQIADIMTNFRESDFSEEDKVLWYQQQISRIAAPINSDVAFNLSNKEMVKGLTGQVQTLVQAGAREMQTAKEKEAALVAAKEQSAQQQRRQQVIAGKFQQVQSMFSQNEAEVYRQIDNVLIRAHGFSFPSGTSEIKSDNFILLNKIIEAINQFPESQIIISGHTDNRGSDELNTNLSNDRAEKVAKFLVEVGRIEPTRLSSKGYGKARPVANNDTVEGRAANRRVEVLIVNKQDMF
jgi:outer membrane protein OmpA-like peptidoglycan-associated protein